MGFVWSYILNCFYLFIWFYLLLEIVPNPGNENNCNYTKSMQAKVGPMILPYDAIDWAKTGSILAHGSFYCLNNLC